METIIIDLVLQNPSLASVVVFFGAFRVVLKPIMTAIQTYVDSTPSKEDDEKLKKIKATKWYKILSWLIDYSLSIKLPK